MRVQRTRAFSLLPSEQRVLRMQVAPARSQQTSDPGPEDCRCHPRYQHQLERIGEDIITLLFVRHSPFAPDFILAGLQYSTRS